MLKQLTHNLWTCSYPVKMPGGIAFSSRSTIVKLEEDKLWIHSPGPFSDEDKKQIEELGKVSFLVAPNLFHNLHLSSAAELFPNAQVFGPQGIEKRLGSKATPLDLKALDTQEIENLWGHALETHHIGGMPSFKESVFYHKSSKTLIVTDCFFNFEKPKGFMTGLVTRMMGTYNGLAQSRLWKGKVTDKEAYKSSMERIREWDFDNLLVAHGRPVMGDARQAVQTLPLT